MLPAMMKTGWTVVQSASPNLPHFVYPMMTTEMEVASSDPLYITAE